MILVFVPVVGRTLYNDSIWEPKKSSKDRHVSVGQAVNLAVINKAYDLIANMPGHSTNSKRAKIARRDPSTSIVERKVL